MSVGDDVCWYLFRVMPISEALVALLPNGILGARCLYVGVRGFLLAWW